MITFYGQILLFSKDNYLIDEVRKEINLIKLKDKNSIEIILIDQRYPFSINTYQMKKEHQYAQLIYIVKDTSYNNIKTLFENGSDYILEYPINKNIFLCVIQKSLGIIKKELDEYTYFHGIELDTNKNIVIYKGCAIPLTRTESLLIRIFLENKGTVNTLNIGSKNISNKYMQVLITRINKKTRNCWGLKIIKNRYNLGYHISI